MKKIKLILNYPKTPEDILMQICIVPNDNGLMIL